MVEVLKFDAMIQGRTVDKATLVLKRSSELVDGRQEFGAFELFIEETQSRVILSSPDFVLDNGLRVGLLDDEYDRAKREVASMFPIAEISPSQPT